MPFTPYHFGPGLLIGLIFFPYLFLPAVLLGSVIVDIEPLTFLLLGLPVVHAFFHTFLGATATALVLAGSVFLLRKVFERFMTLIHFPQTGSPLAIVLGALSGAYSHVLLDAFLYPEMQPFWPLLGNPFLGLISTSIVPVFCILCFIAAIPVYVFQIWRIKQQTKK